MENILISFSGGRTSAFMAKLVLELPKYKKSNIIVVYANTGKENEETLKFIDKCDKEFKLDLVWIEADVIHEKGKGTNYKIVTFETASRKGEPFEQVIKKYGLPSKLYRHCTRELKEVIITKYGKFIFGTTDFYQAIGIRADEPHRIGSNKNKFYPLAEMGFTEDIIRNWWDRQSFDLELKDYQGNCDLCFLKSIRKKLTILEEDESKSIWWDKMEKLYAKEYQNKFDVYRDFSIIDLVDKSKRPFKKALDKHEVNKQQQNMFNADMDMEFDCFCKMN